MTEQIFFCKAQGVRIPVRLEVFKHGGSFYLAYVNHEENVHVPLIGSAGAWLAEFGRAQELIATASRERDQGHISRAGNGAVAPPTLPPGRLNPAAPNWDWLTPQMVIEYFAKSNVLRAIADDVRQVLKDQILESELSRPERDLADVRAANHPGLFKKNGKPNQTVIADILRLPNGGSSNYRRIQEVSTILEEERRNSPISTAEKEPGHGEKNDKVRRRAA